MAVMGSEHLIYCHGRKRVLPAPFRKITVSRNPSDSAGYSVNPAELLFANLVPNLLSEYGGPACLFRTEVTSCWQDMRGSRRWSRTRSFSSMRTAPSDASGSSRIAPPGLGPTGPDLRRRWTGCGKAAHWSSGVQGAGLVRARSYRGVDHGRLGRDPGPAAEGGGRPSKLTPGMRRQAGGMLRDTRVYPFISGVICNLSIGRTAFYHHLPKGRIRKLRR